MTIRNFLEQTEKGVRLNFHPGQAQAWKSEKRFVFVVAGAQSGKTSYGPWWLWREIRRGGPGDYLVATASYDLFKLKAEPETRHVFEEVLRWGTYRAGERVLLSRDGKTRIILRSASSPGGLESATAKAAWLDEVGQDGFRLSAWEAVQRRLSTTQGRVLATTTPYNLGWLKTEVYDRWADGDPDYDVIQFASILNPAFPVEEFRRAKATMVPWKFAMFYLGQFERPAGLIYEDYTDACEVDDFPIPSEWPRHVGVDFGPVHNGMVWLAENPETKCYTIYRATNSGNLTTHQHAVRARALAQHERVLSWWGGAPHEQQPRWDWAKEGVPLRAPPIKDVEAGIDRVVRLLREKRLYTFRSLKYLREEWRTYSREVDERGEPTERIKDKGEFHLLDSLRYVVCGITRPRLVARAYD